MPLDQPYDPPSPVAERTDELRMTLGEHIEDLRKHLLWGLAGILVALGITCTFGIQLIAWLASPLMQAQQAMGYPPNVITTDPTAGFGVFLTVTLIGAVILSAPWIIYQLWRFVVLGLHEHERRLVHLLWPFSAVMTVLGILFAYYILLPVSMIFFFSFVQYYPKTENVRPGFMMKLLMGDATAPPEVEAEPFTLRLPMFDEDPPDAVEGQVWINRQDGQVKLKLHGSTTVLMAQPGRMLTPMPNLADFVRFAAVMILGVVIAFQLPVVMLVVGWTGLVDPAMIAKWRKYALFACFAAGAMLTPTDLFSMFVLAVPLYGLFEFGLFMMRLSFKPEGP